jgi:transient receptor potential cation channel subfamily V protein 5
MGQAESNVTSGVKKQAGVSTQQLYKFVNLKGGGLLVDMMKRAINNKQFAEIDHAIKTKVSFLYSIASQLPAFFTFTPKLGRAIFI